MKGLIIKQPWIDMILSGEKVWEMRSRNTSHRGRIALIQQGAGLVIGSANLTGVVENMTAEEYYSSGHLHRVPGEFGKWRYAWVLADPSRYDEPVPYAHPQGAVIWVNLGKKDVFPRGEPR